MRLHDARPLLVAAALVVYPLAARAAPVTLRVTAGGTTAVQGSAPGSAGPDAATELDIALEEKDVAGAGGSGNAPSAARGTTQVNRSIAKNRGHGREERDHGRARSNPELQRSILGLNFRDQRTANNGNQFSVEPPDQGLCAGNGFVLESVNDVLRVFDAQGNPATGVVDLNTFYGYPAAINRAATPITFGPSITDPSCYFDVDTQRWFHVVLTLDRRTPTAQALSGKNHLDVAVSTSPSPLGSWIVYHIPVQNDGTDGTPDHGCLLNPAGDHGPCLGDYPHIGADATGIFITTNEFSFFGPGFHGAEIYALSKRALARGDANVNAVLFDTADPDLGIVFDGIAGFPGFTVWPAQQPNGTRGDGGAAASGGTQFFLSSQAVFNDSGTDDRLRLWKLSGTRSLDRANPSLSLAADTVNVLTYGVPPPSQQKPGNTPLRDCLADSTLPVGGGLLGCWRLTGAAGTGPFQNGLGELDTNDSRMQQVFLANGKLWGALDTAVTVNGVDRAGIAFFVINPSADDVVNEGALALDGVDLNYPALAVTQSGRGVIAFTAVGPDLFPSAAYAAVDAVAGVGDVHIAAPGAGPQDGFTEYAPFSNRPRWGDYGAAAVDGNSIWLASEYIAQTCTFQEFVASNFTCGNTRTILGNWATRVSQVRP